MNRSESSSKPQSRRSTRGRLSLSTAAVLSACLLLGAPALAQEGNPPPAQKETLSDRIQRLIGQLGNDDYATRESAQQELQKIGNPALPALRKATQSADPEVASRAEESIAFIQKGGVEKTRERKPAPANPFIPRPAPGQPQPPDMEELRKEMERQLPEAFKDIFKQLFGNGGPGGQPDKEEERRGDNSPNRTRVWTWSNQPRPRASGVSGELGISTGRASAVLRAQLGIPNNEGLVINHVAPGSYAEKQGFKQYDVIVALDGRPVRSARDLQKLSQSKGKLELFRKAKPLTLELPPISQKAAGPPKPDDKKKGDAKQRSF